MAGLGPRLRPSLAHQDSFGHLLLASVLGFLLCVVLHNVFEALAGVAEHIAVLHGLLDGLTAAASYSRPWSVPQPLLVSVAALVIALILSRRPST
jgi:hypothetical protein